MYKIIAEQPVLLTVVLGLLAIGFLYGWTREGQKWMAVVGVVLVLLIPFAWLSASLIDTDDEQIRAMINQMAQHVEANDHDAVLAVIHPDRGDILARAKAELPRYEFSRARVGGFNTIRVLNGSNPPEAVVDLIASVTASTAGGEIKDQRVARKLLLYLRKSDEGWKIIDYSHRPPIGDSDGYSTGGGESWENLLLP